MANVQRMNKKQILFILFIPIVHNYFKLGFLDIIWTVINTDCKSLNYNIYKSYEWLIVIAIYPLADFDEKTLSTVPLSRRNSKNIRF